LHRQIRRHKTTKKTPETPSNTPNLSPTPNLATDPTRRGLKHLTGTGIVLKHLTSTGIESESLHRTTQTEHHQNPKLKKGHPNSKTRRHRHHPHHLQNKHAP
jgi:hypothetical protein